MILCCSAAVRGTRLHSRHQLVSLLSKTVAPASCESDLGSFSLALVLVFRKTCCIVMERKELIDVIVVQLHYTVIPTTRKILPPFGACAHSSVEGEHYSLGGDNIH